VTLGNFEYSTYPYLFPVEKTLGRYAKVFVDPDNSYIEVAAELGIPGLLCIMAGAFVVARRFLQAYKTRKDGETREILVAAILVLVVLASQACFHDVAHSPPNVVLGMCAIGAIGCLSDDGGTRTGRKKLESFKRIMGEFEVRKMVSFFVIVMVTVVLWPVFCVKTYVASRHFESASVYSSRNNDLLAEREVDRAISLNPSQAFYHGMAGNLAMGRFSNSKSMDEAKHAIESFSRAISLNPVYPPFHFTSGNCYEFLIPFAKENDKEAYMGLAVASYKKAIDLGPKNCFYRVRLAVLYMKAQDYGSAIKELKESLALEPSFVTAQYLLAQAYERAGDVEQSRETRETMSRTIREYGNYRPRNIYERNLLLDPMVYFREKMG
jgi:tetratricopeptide (TPR) repeat protein